MLAADHMYALLQIFGEAFPKFKELPFHVMGESYAGHYVPAIAYKIYNENKNFDAKNTELSFKIPLKSIAIGNGITDPLLQFPSYADFSEANHLFSPSVIRQMRNALPYCLSLIKECYRGDTSSCR